MKPFSVRWDWGPTGTEFVIGDAEEGLRYRCPCCAYWTLKTRGNYSICQVCYWEDDGQDEAEADNVWGGVNPAISLNQARQNFREIGASHPKFQSHVRPPLPEEL